MSSLEVYEAHCKVIYLWLAHRAGAFAAASAMIAFGAVLGKATPTQVLWLTFIMVSVPPISAGNLAFILRHTADLHHFLYVLPRIPPKSCPDMDM